METSIWRKMAAELIGTWALVLIGPGAAAITLILAHGTKTYSPADIGIGALGGLGDWLAIALAFGLVIIAAIYIFGTVSGAHFNPAVTVALWVTKRFPGKEVVPYILAQAIGAVLGSLCLLALLGSSNGVFIGGLGAPGVFPGISATGAFLAEAFGTFILVLTIMAIAVDSRAPNGLAGIVIGLIVAGIIITFGNISGAGINPARSFGPFLVDQLMGKSMPWGIYLVVYLIAPIVGGVVAAWAYDGIAQPRSFVGGAYDGDQPPVGH